MDDRDLIERVRELLARKLKKKALRKLTIEEVHGGFENKVYLVKLGGTPFILKRRFDGDFDRYPRELEALRRLRDTGLAPAPVAMDIDRGSPCAPLLIIRKIPGELMGNVARTPDSAARIARAFRRLHGVPVEKTYPYRCGFSDLPSYFDCILDYFRYYLRGRVKDDLPDNPLLERMSDFFEGLAAYIDARAGRFDAPALCLCHGDIRLHNMLFYRGEVSLIDWERSGLGDPAFELGLIPLFGHMTSESEEAVYRAYTEGLDDAESFMERVRAYQAVHYFAWPVHMISFLYKLKKEGYRGTWDEDAFVRTYLKEAYEWLALAFRRAGSILGIEGEEEASVASLKERGTLFLWKGKLL